MVRRGHYARMPLSQVACFSTLSRYLVPPQRNNSSFLCIMSCPKPRAEEVSLAKSLAIWCFRPTEKRLFVLLSSTWTLVHFTSLHPHLCKPTLRANGKLCLSALCPMQCSFRLQTDRKCCWLKLSSETTETPKEEYHAFRLQTFPWNQSSEIPVDFFRETLGGNWDGTSGYKIDGFGHLERVMQAIYI